MNRLDAAVLLVGLVWLLSACNPNAAGQAQGTAPTMMPTVAPIITPTIAPTATTIVVIDTPTAAPTDDAHFTPLHFDWSLTDWRINHSNPKEYIGTLLVTVYGGQPPFQIYYNGELQPGNKFEFTAPKCGNWNIRLAIQSADGDYFDSEASIPSPYCSK